MLISILFFFNRLYLTKICDMIDFKNYENAVARHYLDVRINTAPITSWNFHYNIINELRSAFADLNLLEQMGTAFKWQKNMWDSSHNNSDEVIIVTDAKLSIVFASQNITKMNGYTPEEVIGNSPTMFQGKNTSTIVSKQIGKAIQLHEPFEKTVINYKKNGETYICMIKGYPIFNQKGEVSHFIAFERAA